MFLRANEIITWRNIGGADKTGVSEKTARDCEVIVKQSEVMLNWLRGKNPDLRDYWDPDSEIPVPKPEEIRRAKIRQARQSHSYVTLLKNLRNVQVRLSREIENQGFDFLLTEGST